MAFRELNSKFGTGRNRGQAGALGLCFRRYWRGEPNWLSVTLIIIIIVLLLLFGGGGGYYAHRSYGLPGLGGVVGLIVAVLLVLWLFGGLRLGHL